MTFTAATNEVTEGEDVDFAAEPELTFQRGVNGWQRVDGWGWVPRQNEKPKARRSRTIAAMTAAVPEWHPSGRAWKRTKSRPARTTVIVTAAIGNKRKTHRILNTRVVQGGTSGGRLASATG